MDFLDPRKRKAHVRRLYIGYVLVAVLIGLGALILLFASYGYGIDRRGNVFQKGLVFLSSAPDGAQVKITNTNNTFDDTVVTSRRMELKEDTYNFQFLKQGYKPWQHTFLIRGGSIERLVYPLLVPENLSTTADESYTSSPGLVTQSPDRKNILVQQPSSLTSFQVFDASDLAKAPVTFELPAGLLPASATIQSYQLVEWSTDNRHVLVSYTGTEGKIYLVIDRQDPAASINLNTVFGVTPAKVSLRDKDPQRFYFLLADQRLVSADSRDKSSQEIASGVLDFKSHGNNDVLFVTNKDAAPNKVYATIVSNSQPYQIRELDQGDSYILDLAQYNNRWYVVIGSSVSNEAYIYRDPVLALREINNVTTTIRTVHMDNPQRASFSANTRFIAVQHDSDFVVYDAEKDKQYKFTVNPNFERPEAVRWMDGHRLMGTVDGKTMIVDFDGTNQQTLVPTVPGSLPMFNSNFEQLNTLAPSDTGFSLTNTSMRVP